MELVEHRVPVPKLVCNILAELTNVVKVEGPGELPLALLPRHGLRLAVARHAVVVVLTLIPSSYSTIIRSRGLVHL